MLKKYNLYYNAGNDAFVIKDVKGFERIVELELKEEIKENMDSIENLEKEIDRLNEKLKHKKISFFLISKEDDGEQV